MLSSVSSKARPAGCQIVSNVTGRLAGTGKSCAALQTIGCRQVRGAVRFLNGVGVLEAEGVGTSLELGPDGVLTALTVRSPVGRLSAAGGGDATSRA